MSLDDAYLEDGERMETAISALSERLKGIRTGRASPALIEHLKVDYYGEATPFLKIAGISAPEARLLVVKPYDPSVLAAISKAVIASDLGLNPQSDGKVIRITIPPLTEETRRRQSAIVIEEGENAKVAIRGARRDANKAIDVIKKKGEAPEDDCFRMKEEMQEMTRESEEKVAAIVEKKSQEIMQI